MTAPIECLRMNHLNAMVEDFEQSSAHFRELYGAQFVFDLPRTEWHAYLIAIAGVIFEMFVPTEYLLHARFGPHYVGLEYQVRDFEEARSQVEAKEMRVIRNLQNAIHVHPAHTVGVCFEFFGGDFHDPSMPFIEPLKPAEYWRDEHPLGCTGLKRYSVAVADLDAAADALSDFVGAKVVYEEPRPAVAARAVGVEFADTVVELISPTAPGALEQFLARYGNGIRSTVFSVRDLDQAKTYFEERGITLHPGDAPGSLAIAPEDNVGLMFEFSE